MSTVLSLSILLVLSGCAGAAPTSDGYEMGPGMQVMATGTMTNYLVAGQSNAVAHRAERDFAAPQVSTTGLVSINRYAYTNNEDVFDMTTVYVPTLADQAAGSLSWLRLGDMISAATGKPTQFLNVAKGGTTSEHWATELHKRIETALAVGLARDAQAILWVQGESDYYTKQSGRQYYKNMVSVIKKSLAIKPGIVWYLAPTSDCKLPTEIRDAQFRLIANGWALAGPDYDEMRKNPDNVEVGDTHFTGNGHTRLAQAWYEILRR